MSMQHDRAIEPSTYRDRVSLPARLGCALLSRLIGPVNFGELAIETPGGLRLVLKGSRPGLSARVTVCSWQVLWRFLSRSDLSIAESYMAGEWSSPNLATTLCFAAQNDFLAEKILPGAGLWLKIRHWFNRNTRRGSRRNIAAHYDLGNDFYGQWLDAGMNYSAGIFSDAGQSLEAAQKAKLDSVCKLLDVKGGERVLEIGCGWGALAEQLVQERNCTVTGITLSAEQLAYAKHRLRKERSVGSCDLRLEDYRDTNGSYDRVVSVEMLEAVGEAYWPTYFRKLRDSLRPGGLAVLQVITIDPGRYERYRRHPDFIQRYIFPGGMLPTAEIIRRETETSGLELVSSEFFGQSYAFTIQQWKLRFEKAWPAINALGFDMRFRKMWEYYFAYCEAGFATEALNVGFYKIAKRH